MRWQDDAIILSIRKFSEHGALVHVFSRERGACKGITKSAMSKKHRGTYQAGNLVHVEWSARLEEHVGTISCELQHPFAALIIQDSKALNALSSAVALCELTMQERDPHPKLYDALIVLLHALAEGKSWHKPYALFEWVLLAEAGFGLDTAFCAATGQSDDLIYLSPKSGRAVSREAGAPYHNKLFLLPECFKNPEAPASKDDIYHALRITSHFLVQWLLPSIHRSMPAARDRCVNSIMSLPRQASSKRARAGNPVH